MSAGRRCLIRFLKNEDIFCGHRPYPDVDRRTFSTGQYSCPNMRYLNLDSRFFTMQIIPSGETGFSELIEGDAQDLMGHDHVFPSWEDAMAFFKQQITTS